MNISRREFPADAASPEWQDLAKTAVRWSLANGRKVPRHDGSTQQKRPFPAAIRRAGSVTQGSDECIAENKIYGNYTG